MSKNYIVPASKNQISDDQIVSKKKGYIVKKYLKNDQITMYLNFILSEFQYVLDDDCVHDSEREANKHRLDHRPLETIEYSLTIEFFDGSIMAIN